jgi:CRISPR type IV-associated protein Csf1
MITAPQLFAGILNPTGNNKCFYCGGVCDDTHKSKEYVKDTFTNRDIVKYPDSEFVCSGCVCSLNERATITMIDGEVRESQKTRLYSWLFDSKSRIAFTKAHLSVVKEIFLNPPEPPFGIVLAVSGQKQLLFRSVLAWNKQEYYVMLEDEKILVNVNKLKAKLDQAEKIIAGIGKVAALDVNLNCFIRYNEYFSEIESLEKWVKENNSPLSRLAVYLSPNQKECQNVYPKRDSVTRVESRGISAQVSLFD